MGWGPAVCCSLPVVCGAAGGALVLDGSRQCECDRVTVRGGPRGGGIEALSVSPLGNVCQALP